MSERETISLLISAIVALSGVVAVLWREHQRQRRELRNILLMLLENFDSDDSEFNQRVNDALKGLRK